MTLDDIKARCDEVGDCWIWTGITDGRGRANIRIDGKNVSCRRFVRALVDGKPVPRGLVSASPCGDPLCVSPVCSRVATHKIRSKIASERNAYANKVRDMRGSITKRAQSWITDELVEQIRIAPGPSKKISLETKVSLSYVKAIRRGVARKPLGSPFAGLMG